MSFTVDVELPDTISVETVGEELSGQTKHPEAGEIEAVIKEAYESFVRSYELSLEPSKRHPLNLKTQMTAEPIDVTVHIVEDGPIDAEFLNKHKDYLLELISLRILDELDVDRFHTGPNNLIKSIES